MTERNRSNFTNSAHTLLNQLRELDEFESDLSAAPQAAQRLHITTAPSQRVGKPHHRWWMSLGGMAVAATLLIAFMMNQRSLTPSEPLANTTLHHPADNPTTAHAV